VSKSIYTVDFDTSDVIREIERIRDELEQTSKEIERNRRERLAKLDWKPVTRQIGDVQIPAKMFEVAVPPEFTEDAGIKGETALVSIEEHGIRVMLTDASLPAQKCDGIAARLAKKLYEDATGVTLRPDQVIVRPMGSTITTICEHCKEAVEGFPYRCAVCGRCFCYDHKSPTAHGCQLKQKTMAEEQARVPKRASRPSAKRSEPAKPSVVVTRLPCG
jgi:hypothetical protein